MLNYSVAELRINIRHNFLLCPGWTIRFLQPRKRYGWKRKRMSWSSPGRNRIRKRTCWLIPSIIRWRIRSIRHPPEISWWQESGIPPSICLSIRLRSGDIYFPFHLPLAIILKACYRKKLIIIFPNILNNINGLEGNPGILRWTMELVALAKKVRGKYILTYRFIAYLGMGYIICEICV